MYSFNYQRATSVEQARERLQEQPGARLLAGGQSLVASMKLRLTDPAELVDLGGIASLAGIRVPAPPLAHERIPLLLAGNGPPYTTIPRGIRR